MWDRRLRALVAAGAVVVGLGACASSPEEPAGPSTPEPFAVTRTGLAVLDSISTDGRWLVGTEPRDEGASTPKPLVRLDRQTGEQLVLCDWADPDLGYCSLAEQGGMIPEKPQLLLELLDDNAVRGWFPDGGAWLVDTTTGQRARIDVDAAGTPLEPAWAATGCRHECDYYENPRLHMTTDAVSGDGRLAAFCANYTAPREPLLYVKDLASGQLTRTGVRCGVIRSGREDDDDEWADEAMSYPQVSADGSVVHVSGDQSTGGEYGRIGWQPDTLYLTATGESRTVPGSGAMTRDGRTLYLRSGTQPEVPETEVDAAYVGCDVASGSQAPLPWMRDFLATTIQPAPVPDLFAQASADGSLLLNETAVHDAGSGAEVDIGAVLSAQGYALTTEWGPLRISGDGTTLVAAVTGPDPLAEASARFVLVTGWDRAP